MIKIKDRIFLGSTCGIIAAAVARTVNRINYKFGLTDIRYNPMAANLFIPKKNAKSSSGSFLGLIVNNINVSVNGIALTYLLSMTGKDYKIIKGLGAGAFSWIIVDGMFGSGKLKIKSNKPLGPIVHFLEHAFYGVLLSTLITKFGDDNLFPSNIKTKYPSNNIPLIYTGIDKEKE